VSSHPGPYAWGRKRRVAASQQRPGGLGEGFRAIKGGPGWPSWYRRYASRENLPPNPQGAAGFTLLEVIISMAILVFISFGIYQATTETYRLREILSQEGDFYNGIRLAMNILERDVQMVFSPLHLVPKKKEAAPGAPSDPFAPPGGAGAPQAADPADVRVAQSEKGQTSQYWQGASDKTGIRPMHFIGSPNKLSFVSTSYIRVYKGSPFSDFAKVSYELEKDEGNTEHPEALMLVKTESPNAFEDDESKDKFKRRYPLLRGIKSMSFRYLRRKDGSMVPSTSWDSDSSDYKNLYPEIIEVRLEVVGPLRLNFEGIYKLRPEGPLDPLDPST
jgi:prepilin-type N-terminal cleavage/methylation domain-containing protein